MGSVRIDEFDTWRPGYGLDTVTVLVANTTTNASIFLDQALTQAAPNPQTLVQMTNGGISYGKFAQPLYTGAPYYLQINSVDRTGVQTVPITTLQDQDASEATVVPTGASIAGNLDDILARRIDVRDYGAFLQVGANNASAITNNATLAAAIGVAGAAGGGFVEIPAGTYAFTSLTIPGGVVLRGAGQGATILQSTQSGNVCTLADDLAGFERLTLDGINQVTGSIGVFAENIDFIHFNDVMIQRFDTCLQRKGGTGSHWWELYISDFSSYGYQCHGDSDSGKGGPVSNEVWDGGKIELGGAIAIGLELKYVDSTVAHLTFKGIGFDSNSGTAISVIGTQTIKWKDCWWNNNGTNLAVADGLPLTDANSVIGLEFIGGSMGPQVTPVAASGNQAAVAAINSAVNLTGTLQSVAFRQMELSYVTVNITTPSNNILAEDCREITGMSFGGNTPTAWVRAKTFDHGASAGLTTGNAWTIGWSLSLDPGNAVYLEAKVIGRSRSSIDTGFFHVAVSAHRPGASLLFDGYTNPFSAGDIVTGQTSGATARIIAVQQTSASTGTLTLQDIDGTFTNNESIQGPASGNAFVNGSVTDSPCVLLGSTTSLRPAQLTDSNWGVQFVALGSQIQLQVAGDTSMNVEWTLDVDVKAAA